MKTLDISHARQRMLYGRTNSALASRFLKEIPEEHIQRKGGNRLQADRPSYSQGSYGSSYGGSYGGQRPVSAQAAARQAQIKKSQKSSLTGTAAAAAPAPVMLELSKGDMVQHKAFGRGLVLTAMKVGGDVLLEIAFDQVGTKKLFAKTASAHMKKL